MTDERYVLYPIHFQPEASTLVQAPYYLDQAVLIEDISKSLPVGYQLYVKEHVSNRGRRPLAFYKRLRETFGVRLLGPYEDTWTLIRDAAAVAVITGTVGWEGLLFGKPVVTFGDVFYNECASPTGQLSSRKTSGTRPSGERSSNTSTTNRCCWNSLRPFASPLAPGS